MSLYRTKFQKMQMATFVEHIMSHHKMMNIIFIILIKPLTLTAFAIVYLTGDFSIGKTWHYIKTFLYEHELRVFAIVYLTGDFSIGKTGHYIKTFLYEHELRNLFKEKYAKLKLYRP